jgi:YD repeat-containing protein
LPNGVVVLYEYDAAKRLTTIKNAVGDSINYEYDIENNCGANYRHGEFVLRP